MTDSRKPLVSIVTPVYNGGKYIAECIRSVFSQTYENWEYIIVNNKSTDSTPEIIQQFAVRDARIRIHNNDDFLPLMQNWNSSLRLISPSSKYCKVVHADDWLFPECIARMVDIAEACPSVGIVGAYSLRDKKVALDGLPYDRDVFPGREICRLALLQILYVFGSPSSILMRSDFIRQRKDFYNEENLHADVEACYEMLKKSDFGFVHQVLTFTRIHDESQSSFAKRYNTFFLNNLTCLTKYGPIYLSREELQESIEWGIKVYHAFLVKSFLERKGKDFIQYHKDGLLKLGYKINILELMKSSCIVFYKRPLNSILSMLGR